MKSGNDIGFLGFQTLVIDIFNVLLPTIITWQKVIFLY